MRNYNKSRFFNSELKILQISKDFSVLFEVFNNRKSNFKLETKSTGEHVERIFEESFTDWAERK